MQPETRPLHLTLDAMRGFCGDGNIGDEYRSFCHAGMGLCDSKGLWWVVRPTTKISWIFSFIFIDGKMRGLFSLMFGASMMLVIERAQAKGESADKGALCPHVLVGPVRTGTLFLSFGSVTFYFCTQVWDASRSSVPELGASERLIKWALILFGLGILLLWGLQLGGLQVLQYFATQPDADRRYVAKQYNEIIARAMISTLNVEDETRPSQWEHIGQL